MNTQIFPSKLLAAAVDELAALPGIGRKTALRLALYLLRQPCEQAERFGNAILALRREVKQCRICGNISDMEICEICADRQRNASVICVVETVKDIMSIESTLQYNGLYHVLGGLISPIDNVAPSDLNIESLLRRAAADSVSEIIIAVSTTMEGETTAHYLFRRLKEYPLAITTLARGVGFGDELEYADEITLGRSIKNRTPFEHIFEHKN